MKDSSNTVFALFIIATIILINIIYSLGVYKYVESLEEYVHCIDTNSDGISDDFVIRSYSYHQ